MRSVRLLKGRYLLCRSPRHSPGQLSWLPTQQPAPPFSCTDQRYNTEGGDNENVGNQTSFTTNMNIGHYNARGTAAGDCTRVSSVGIFADASNGDVEVGWVIGWVNASNNVYTGTGACTSTYYTAPQLFVAWEPTTGGFHCKMFGTTLPQDTSESFAAKNPDANYVFQLWDAGTDYWGATVDFTRGAVYTNGERHSLTYDSAYAHFSGQQWMVAGQSTWYSVTSPYVLGGGGTDPDYNWYELASNETKVDTQP